MPVENVHGRSLATSSALSGYYMAKPILPLDVIRVLNRAKIRFVLLGAHGIGGWMRKPRATEDVDVLVGVRGQKKAVRELLAEYPHLLAEDHEVVTRLRDPETDTIVIDVMKANQPLYSHALKYTQTVESGGESYEIPSLELALATKLAAMISLSRADRDKFQDARDFMYMVDMNPAIDLVKLHVLGQLIYNGGGDEIVEKVRQVRAGERLKL
jgi:hypothetical protein